MKEKRSSSIAIAPTEPRTSSSQAPVIGIASTFKFIPKSTPPEDVPKFPAENLIPKDTHWADCVKPDTVVVIEQPAGQFCASLGGIMATRMSVLGAKGVVVDGRVRDKEELEGSGLAVSFTLIHYVR